VILSFGDAATEDLYHGRRSGRSRRLAADVQRSALRKLDMLNAARELRDFKSPPENRLEALKGDLAGHFSIRVNDRWRVVFRWQGSDAVDVRILDYHGG